MKLKLIRKKKRELTPEEKARQYCENEKKLEKGDVFAMLASAFFTLFLPTVLILTVMVLIVLWIGGVF